MLKLDKADSGKNVFQKNKYFKYHREISNPTNKV